MVSRRAMTEELEAELNKIGAAYLRMRAAAPTGKDFDQRCAQFEKASEAVARRAIAAGFGVEGA